MDCVAVIVIGAAKVFVASAGCDWEPSCLVGVYFSFQVYDFNKHVVCTLAVLGFWELVDIIFCAGRCSCWDVVGGPEALPVLFEVAVCRGLFLC